MFCCPECFNHTFLKDYIKNNSSKKGMCSFCSNNFETFICAPKVLNDLFQPIIDLYVEDINGKPLIMLLQDEWKIFTNKVDKKHQSRLLSKIAYPENLSKKRFVSITAPGRTLIDKWNAFSDELKHENRFLPVKNIDTDQFSELFNYLIMTKSQKPYSLFRARINHQPSVYSLSEMGKPPFEKSIDGRANPKGISYFYGASDEKTAVSETRPYKTENVSVAKFKVDKRISLIDLRDPKCTISPFGLDDDSLFLLYSEHMPLLVHLSETLSKPVLPHKKDLEYIPSQYLCELIKYNSFNGIAFKSSLDQGDNYVIFDDTFLTGKKVGNYIVSGTAIEFKKVK